MIDALSLRARLTVWYTIVLVVVLSLFAVDVLLVQQRRGLRRMDEQLDELHATLTNMVREELQEDSSLADAAAEARDTVAAPGAAIAILDTTGNALASRLSGASLPDLVRRPSGTDVNAVVRERHEFHPGEMIRLAPQLSFLFDPASGARLA